MNKEFFEAVRLLTEEKDIPADYLYEKIASAIVVAANTITAAKILFTAILTPKRKKLKFM